jgi:flagellar biosynthesis GTPase FlhF
MAVSAVVAAAAATTASVYQGRQAGKQAKKAQAENVLLQQENLAQQERAAQQQAAAFSAQEAATAKAMQDAERQANLADQANNRANKKRPNVGARLEANQAASTAGGGSTMLTGPGGVDSGSLALGRNTLLGQ